MILFFTARETAKRQQNKKATTTTTKNATSLNASCLSLAIFSKQVQAIMHVVLSNSNITRYMQAPSTQVHRAQWTLT